MNTVARSSALVLIVDTYPLEQYREVFNKAEAMYATTDDSVVFCSLSRILYKIILANVVSLGTMLLSSYCMSIYHFRPTRI